jgi:hypothetical protein
MSNDPSVRRILPQQDLQDPQASQMNSFQFAPQQFPQHYVFVDEHNRHKRLKVMRACEGCRRRKIKCDAATTNTWPCSACIRLKLHCVRPNGYDGTADTTYDTPMDGTSQFQHAGLQAGLSPHAQATPRQATSTYASSGYSEGSSYQSYDPPQPPMGYTTVADPMSMSQPYADQQVFPTPPMPGSSRPDEPSPDAYSPDAYQQHDLADLLGSLKVDEKGTGMFPTRYGSGLLAVTAYANAVHSSVFEKQGFFPT